MEHVFSLVGGLDLGGIVDAVGPGVEGLAPGDAVFGVHSKAFVGAFERPRAMERLTRRAREDYR